jgi:hydroxypyruvate reductase
LKAVPCQRSLYWSSEQPVIKDFLQNLFGVAVAAVDPANCLSKYLPSPGTGRTFVIGAGKAVPGMVESMVANYAAPSTGVVVTRYGNRIRGEQPQENSIHVLEAAHPVPDRASIVAGQCILKVAEDAGANDRIIVLLSGGASALMEYPLPGIGLADLQTINQQLLSCGADIAEINCVRKKISALKGGRLALAAAPAEILVYAISDVPGDNLAEIGSGPCSIDATDRRHAREILRRYALDVPASVLALLQDRGAGDEPINAATFERVQSQIIARGQDALDAVAAAARQSGFEPVLLGADINGSAAAVAREHASLVAEYKDKAGRFALISGGETTVKVKNPDGRGGRNGTYLLNLALALEDADGVHAIAADTDGIDGTEENAGAYIGPDTLLRAARLGLSADKLLAANRSYDFFSALDDLIVTGPTGTNVNDLRIIIVTGQNS